MTKPYVNYVENYRQLLREQFPTPPTAKPPEARAGVPTALLFSPHPDDESINGGFALRLKNEMGMQIVNVELSLGSAPERRARRKRELENACGVLQFAMAAPIRDAFASINFTERLGNPPAWTSMVDAVVALITRYHPSVIICPHQLDGHQAHIGAHYLVMDALRHMPATFACHLVFNEYWQQQAAPNLLLEISAEDASLLLTALCCHEGEIARNPYHLRLLSWLADNVRRGAEVIAEKGATAPDFAFGLLLTRARWENGKLVSIGKHQAFAATDNIKKLLEA